MLEHSRIAILGSQERDLSQFLMSHPEKHERAAIVLFRRLHRPVEGLAESDRYLAVAVIPFEEAWVVDSSTSHVRFQTKPLRELFRRCEEEGLVFGFAHSHPLEVESFSSTDEENERTLLQALTNRNGRDIHFIALLRTAGGWAARVRHGVTPDEVVPVRHILVVGTPMQMFGYQETEIDDSHMQARQAAAFGQPFVDMLASLRIGIVGAGGTGSPVITLLARAGIGEMVIVDHDVLARHNLNRTRGAAVRDLEQNKARILKSFVTEHLELATRIAAIESRVDESPVAVDAISSCDVLFGCTDDQIGRELLNAALYVYVQPYIDVGLGGQIADDEHGHPYLRYHYARVSTILPEGGECLFCQGVISAPRIRYEYELRVNPDLTEQQARERYLEGGGAQAPGVGPFTSAAADYAVANLFDLLRPFRNFPPEVRPDKYTIDFVKMEICSSAAKDDEECPYCGKRGFLLLREKSRLNRPALGKPNVAI